jgi:hypothetical protein
VGKVFGTVNVTEVFPATAVKFGMCVPVGSLVHIAIVLLGLSQIITPKLFTLVGSNPTNFPIDTPTFAEID